MPRQRRQLSNSGIYHIMLRGNERKEIFSDDQDRLRFLDILNRMGSNNEFEIYAYCLMSNHIHLLFKEGKSPIQRSLKRVTVSYVYYFNHKYGRIGHLFQDRFKSERIENDSYLILCTKYIHNNPVKAGLADKAVQYKWSSFRQYAFCDKNPMLKINIEFVLGLFSQNINKAVELFIADSGIECNNAFMDCEDTHLQNEKKSWEELCKDIKIKYSVSIEEIAGIENKSLRNKIIKDIKTSSSLSLNELSSKLGLSKYIICRA